MFFIIYGAKLSPTYYTIFKHILQSCYTDTFANEKNVTFLLRVVLYLQKKTSKTCEKIKQVTFNAKF